MMNSSELKRLCKKQDIDLVELPNGHFQIKGKLLVNYYPDSKKRTCYVAGTVQGKRACTPRQAIEMANTAPEVSHKKDSRSGGSRAKRAALIKKGVTDCRWCKKPLTLDDSTLEHVIPLNRGGLDNANNRTLACADCNHDRADGMPELDKE